ncbi:hypothetical protein ACFV3E_37765 [Streptomyces sp. NPDC059718]
MEQQEVRPVKNARMRFHMLRVASVTELRLELPYEFHREEYEQILHDVRHLVAPELGWRPAEDDLPAGRPLPAGR